MARIYTTICSICADKLNRTHALHEEQNTTVFMQCPLCFNCRHCRKYSFDSRGRTKPLPLPEKREQLHPKVWLQTMPVYRKDGARE